MSYQCMSFYEKASAFLLRKLEVAKLLGLYLAYSALMEVILPLSILVVQNFFDVKQVEYLDNLFTLCKYELRHLPCSQVNLTAPSGVQKASPPPPFSANLAIVTNVFHQRRSNFALSHQNFSGQQFPSIFFMDSCKLSATYKLLSSRCLEGH